MTQDNQKNKKRGHPDVIFMAKVWVGVVLLAVLVDFFDIKLGSERYMEQKKPETDLRLPLRTNTGDTLYVLEKCPKKNGRIYASRPDGTTGIFKFQGAERVNPGDTIVINSKHKFLMKNITQRNLERQK